MVAHVITRLQDEQRRAHAFANLTLPSIQKVIKRVVWHPALVPDGLKWGAMNTRVRGMRKQAAFGCMLSHYQALQMCHLNGLDAWIFEDDFFPMPGLELYRPEIEGVDMFFWGWITWGGESEQIALTDDWHLRTGFAGTHAYFVPHERIERILEWFGRNPWTHQIDNALCHAMRDGQLTLAFKSGPRFLQNTELATTIGNSPHPNDVIFAEKFLHSKTF
jgi:hypothetical protein